MREFKFVVTQNKKEKYNKACDYLEKLGRISLDDEKCMSALQYKDYIGELEYKSKIKWIKNHHKELYYNRYFKDVGYAFCDIIDIYSLETDKKVFEFSFLDDIDCNNFLVKTGFMTKEMKKQLEEEILS